MALPKKSLKTRSHRKPVQGRNVWIPATDEQIREMEEAATSDCNTLGRWLLKLALRECSRSEVA